MSVISLRLDSKEDLLIKTYAKAKNISVSELLRNAVIEKIEDEIDLQIFDAALAETKKTYTLSEAKRELELDT